MNRPLRPTALLLLLYYYFSQPFAISKSPQPIPSLLVGPSIVDVPARIRNVFAAQNFNRNVTVPWWETQILNGDNHIVEETLRILSDAASFIVFNAEMYQVGLCRATEVRY